MEINMCQDFVLAVFHVIVIDKTALDMFCIIPLMWEYVNI